MSRVLFNITLISRLLLAISIALIISSIIADLYGAKLNSVYENMLPQNPGTSIFLGVAGLTSSGKVKIEVRGASTAYYLKLHGDPFTIVQQLRALRLNISAVRPKTDLRAGVAYTMMLIQNNPAVIQALSALGNLIQVVRTENLPLVVEESLNTGEAIVMIVPSAVKATIVPSAGEPSVKVRIEYTVEGYHRLTPAQAVIASAVILVMIAAIELGRRTARFKV